MVALSWVRCVYRSTPKNSGYVTTCSGGGGSGGGGGVWWGQESPALGPSAINFYVSDMTLKLFFRLNPYQIQTCITFVRERVWPQYFTERLISTTQD